MEKPEVVVEEGLTWIKLVGENYWTIGISEPGTGKWNVIGSDEWHVAELVGPPVRYSGVKGGEDAGSS